jgi:hypothetical protein
VIGENVIRKWAPRMGLIVNASVKGQEGWRKTAGQRITLLEPYSALAPAHPAAFTERESKTPGFCQRWLKAALPDIEKNNRASLRLALRVPVDVAFCDLIYAPAETIFLRHARFSGHRTLNGKGMIVAQAAEALFHGVVRNILQDRGEYNSAGYARVLNLMFASW